MATDMQPFLTGLRSRANRSISETGERNAGLPPGAADNRFGSILGTAQARRTESRHEALPVHPGQTAHLRTSKPSIANSQTERSPGIAATAKHEESAPPTEAARPERADDSDEGQDDQNIKASDQSAQPSTLPPEMLLAVGITTQTNTNDQVEHPAHASSLDAANAVEETAAKEVAAEKPLGLPAPDLPSAIVTAQSASITPPTGQTAQQAPTDTTTKGATDHAAGLIGGSDTHDGQSGTPIAAPLVEVQHQDASDKTLASLDDSSSKEIHREPDTAKAAMVAISSHLTGKPASGVDAADQSALQPTFESVMQGTGASALQNGSSAEQHSGQDYQSSSDSQRGSDHSKSNLPLTENNTLRPQFVDPTTGMSPSAPSSGDTRVGRGESGQNAVFHLSESERANELRGASSFTQSVTVDLDPLDMGPLRVRVMMTDQIVHAHIRTEHGELGQGLLQQGQSLESSLRTTGLEMGMLRVTVDQQQGRGENAWAFQQQQGRPGLASGAPPAPGDDERALRPERGVYNNGRVSFFA